jgi:uncharacterized protein (DUF302 family)
MPASDTQELGLRVVLPVALNAAETLVRAALLVEGFGVLTEIDVQATLKKKLEVDFQPYKILGACNPKLAYRALQIAPEVGLLLPCNVVVNQLGENQTEVSFINPSMMMSVLSDPRLSSVAQEAGEKLARVAASLA